MSNQLGAQAETKSVDPDTIIERFRESIRTADAYHRALDDIDNLLQAAGMKDAEAQPERANTIDKDKNAPTMREIAIQLPGRIAHGNERLSSIYSALREQLS